MSLIIKKFRAEEWLQALACLVLVIAQVWLDLRLPDYMSEITTLLQTPGSAVADIWAAGGSMLVCALLSFVCASVTGFFAARIAASFSRRMRAELYDRVEAFSMEEIGRFSTASLITRSTNDIMQVQMLIAMGLQAMIKAPIMSAWAIMKIAGKDWHWTLATGIAVFALVICAAGILTFAMPKFRIVQEQTDKLNAVLRENITGVRVVRAYNSEHYQEAKLEKANKELTNTNLFVSRVMAVMQPGMQIIMNGLTLAIYWIGAFIISSAAASGASMAERIGMYSDMIVYSSYAMQVVMSFMMLTMIFVILPRATVSANRIKEVLYTTPKILDGTMTEPPERRGEVEFKNVSFRYPGAEEDVLHDISFTAKRGETIAFIGSTGSGKSTVVNLIPRFYDVTEGEILLDGVDVRDYKLEELHNRIGYVPQRAVLFSGTIGENIAFGDAGGEPPDGADIARAAEIAQGAEFIDRLEDGYEHHVAQGGMNLSGGQRQRVAIARAVCRDPEIYIFDDSFSALDYKTDRELRARLKEHTGDATLFIVAQRIGTIRNADRIIVIDEGRVVGQGRHEELLKTCEVYREIGHSQLTAEELQ